MIRQAKPEDIDLIYELCVEGLTHTPYSHIGNDELDTRRNLAGFIVTGAVWVTDDIDGIIIGAAQPMWFNSKKIAATDLLFYVKDSAKSAGVRLAKEYIKWAQGFTDIITLNISFGGDIERTEKFYEKLGFKKVGGSYLMKGD